jgi:hypothetical protein
MLPPQFFGGPIKMSQDKDRARTIAARILRIKQRAARVTDNEARAVLLAILDLLEDEL